MELTLAALAYMYIIALKYDDIPKSRRWVLYAAGAVILGGILLKAVTGDALP